MNSTMYWVIGAGIVILAIAIVLQLARGRGVTVAGVKVVRDKGPILDKSHDQLVRDHIAPVFEDLIDKERAEVVKDKLFSAYKDATTTIVGVHGTVKGG